MRPVRRVAVSLSAIAFLFLPGTTGSADLIRVGLPAEGPRQRDLAFLVPRACLDPAPIYDWSRPRQDVLVLVLEARPLLAEDPLPCPRDAARTPLPDLVITRVRNGVPGATAAFWDDTRRRGPLEPAGRSGSLDRYVIADPPSAVQEGEYYRPPGGVPDLFVRCRRYEPGTPGTCVLEGDDGGYTAFEVMFNAAFLGEWRTIADRVRAVVESVKVP